MQVNDHVVVRESVIPGLVGAEAIVTDVDDRRVVLRVIDPGARQAIVLRDSRYNPDAYTMFINYVREVKK